MKRPDRTAPFVLVLVLDSERVVLTSDLFSPRAGIVMHSAATPRARIEHEHEDDWGYSRTGETLRRTGRCRGSSSA